MTLLCGVLISVTDFIYNYSTPIPCPVDRDDIVSLITLDYGPTAPKSHTHVTLY